MAVFANGTIEACAGPPGQRAADDLEASMASGLEQ